MCSESWVEIWAVWFFDQWGTGSDVAWAVSSRQGHFCGTLFLLFFLFEQLVIFLGVGRCLLEFLKVLFNTQKHSYVILSYAILLVLGRNMHLGFFGLIMILECFCTTW